MESDTEADVSVTVTVPDPLNKNGDKI